MSRKKPWQQEVESETCTEEDKAAEPEWDGGIPHCSEICRHHDGKRCGLIGFRPESICEPAVSAMATLIERGKAQS